MPPPTSEPPRCAILPPAPVPYRDPLFERLAARGQISPRVIYVNASQPSWDMGDDWFSSSHAYDSVRLRSWQRARKHAGRTPVAVPRGLLGALRRFDPACVVSWEFGPTTLLALAWCRLRGRALVVFSELPPQADAILSPAQLRLHRLLAPRVDGFVVASSAAARRAVGLGANPARVAVSLQSARLDGFVAAGEQRTERAEGPVRILSVARLVPDKNLAALVRAVAPFSAEEVVLDLCGTGPLERDLRRLAERLGAPVELRGHVAPAELPAIYAGSDVFALVSGFEPFGVALREAAAARLPLLCTRASGAVGDIAVEGRNALLVEPDNQEAIDAAVARLVADAQLRSELSMQSAAVTDEHRPEDDAAAFEGAVLAAVGR